MYLITKDQLRRIIARKARPVSEEEFRSEFGEFDPEVYSQDPLSEDGEFEIASEENPRDPR